VYEGIPVPAVLMSGNHAEIQRWRLKQALGRTWSRRPELLARLTLSSDQQTLLEEYKRDAQQQEAARIS
jgi:tRNA (guanine37-N1)-methyltransferase